ncbi:MAG: pantetheine-phosphate adenylyltransferase [Ignavibacteriae bacterium]|nr:pantetheine-phosphate adenylyltransferase [Ignavibacteriota bacterium]
MRTAIYPGTFDPITNGHLDIIERASVMFDRVIVVIAVNSTKTPLFSMSERVELVRDVLSHLSNTDVVLHEGLMIDCAREHSAIAIIRGLRAISDFEYEFQMALMNRKLEPSISTIFLMPHEKYTYLNSTIIRELARYRQNVSEFVSPKVAEMLSLKYGEQLSSD